MRKIFIYLLLLITNAAYSQLLNSSKLKIVSEISINNQIYKFDYDDKLRLKKITGIIKEDNNIYEDIFYRNENSLSYKQLVNGKENKKLECKYTFIDNKIHNIITYEYNENTCMRYLYEFTYDNDVLKESFMYKTWIENNTIIHDPQINHFYIDYYNRNPYIQKCIKTLTSEQRKKYAPLYEENEFIESRDFLKETIVYNSIDEIEYSDIYINDTNIRLNNIMCVRRQGYNNIHSIYDNILYYTSWIPIPEYNLIEYRKIGKRIIYDIKYLYKDNNITDILYINRNSGKTICKISIKYLMPS